MGVGILFSSFFILENIKHKNILPILTPKPEHCT